VFKRFFPPPYDEGRRAPSAEEAEDAYKPIVDWFAEGNAVVVQDQRDEDEALLRIPTLADLVRRCLGRDGRRLPAHEVPAGCELVLEGLHQASLLSKDRSSDGVTYGDMLKRMFAGFED
jgi:magnesium chelatase subunit I